MRLTLTEAQDLALYLRTQVLKSSEIETDDFAFLLHDDSIYWASSPNDLLRSTTTELIQGLFARYADQSFFILRKRIFSTETARLVCRNMVKVAAKRLTDSLKVQKNTEGEKRDWSHFKFEKISAAEQSEWLEAERDAYEFWPEGTRPKSNEDFLRLSLRLASSVERGSILHRYDRAVGCVITNREGEILIATVNRSSRDKTRHAEWNACELWLKKSSMLLPKGARVFVSLKPCRMCAAALVQLAEDPQTLQVFYAENDPGSFAQETVLDQKSYDQAQLDLKTFAIIDFER